MYPTISHLIEDLFGIYIPLPIQTFGFFFALAFIAAAYIISSELKRKEDEGLVSIVKIEKIVGEKLSFFQIITTLLSGFLIGYKVLEGILNYEDLVDNPQKFLLSSRGNLFGGFLFAAYSFYTKNQENKKQILDKPKLIIEKVHAFELVGNITMVAAFSGILGAKVFHILENFGEFLKNPYDLLISFSGFTFYGGLIFGALAVVYYCRKHKINTIHLLDSSAPSLMLAYAVGRMGCHMSGDGDWGIVNLAPKPDWLAMFPDWVWSYNFPNNVINAGVYIEGCTGRFCSVLPEPVWPTSLYEIVMCLMLFGLLWSIRKKISIPGLIFSIYLILNGTERFFIEKIRVNTEYNFLGGITQAEIISFCLIITGILTSIFFIQKNRNKNIS